MGLFLFLAAAAQALVGKTGEASTHKRSHDEEPHLTHSAPNAVGVGEQGDAKRTGGVDRSVGQRDADEVDEYQGKTDGQTTKLAVGVATVGDAEDDHQEHEGQQGFNEESTTSGNGLIARIGTTASLLEGFTEAVGSENTSVTSTRGFPNEEKQSTSNDAADELGSPVAKHLLQRHAAIGPNAEADGGIKVCTRNVANAVGHGYNGQTEGDGNAKETDMSKESSTATSKDQNERAEQFGEEFVTNFHNVLIFNWLLD